MNKLIFGFLLAIFSCIPITLSAQYIVFDQNFNPITPFSTVDVGTKTVGSQTDVVFTIQNFSADILFINDVLLVGLGSHFSVIGANGLNIFPNQSAQFTIRFAPTSVGTHTALVQFLTNDPEFHDFTISGNAGSCSAPTTPVLTTTQPTCSIATGAITVTIQNASDTYSFNNGTTFQASNSKSTLTAGNYQVKIKNAAGCVSTATSATINVAPGSPTTPVVTITQPTCSVTNGTITVTVQNASDNYSFNNGTTFQVSNTKSSLTVGNYQVKIKNAAGCISNATSTTINVAPASPATPVLTISQPTCSVVTGTVTVTVQNASDTYSFDNGTTFQVSNSKSVLGSGNYSIKIKNSVGCISSATGATINTAPAVPATPVVAITQPTCSVATGIITVTVQNASDSYSFDNGTTFQAGNSKSALGNGNYSIKIKNSAVCISLATGATINAAPAVPATPVVAITQPTCSIATGIITVTVQNASDTYSFDNGTTFQASNSKSGLTPASYDVKIKNVVGCVSTAASTTINTAAPGAPTTPAISITQPTCSIATGIITVTVQNVSDTYSFDNGSTFQTSNTKSGLVPASYDVRIKGGAGCISSATSAIINVAPGVPTSPALTTIQPTCSVATGTITVIVQNASDTYSFDDGTTFQASNIKSGLASGGYQVKIKNAAGCVSTAAGATINAASSSPATPVLTTTQPTCSVATGTITITIQNASDTYSFDNGTTFQASNVKSGLATGGYQVKIKNTAGCVSAATSSIINAAPALPIVSITQPTCLLPTGTISVIVQNGSDNYSFDNGVTFQALNSKSGLSPGNFQIKVKTSSGCISVATTAIVNPPPANPLPPNYTVTQLTCTVSTGGIAFIPYVSPETYSFDDGLSYQTGSAKNFLNPGAYSIKFKNLAGCVSATAVVVINPSPTVAASPIVSVVHPTSSTPTGSITINVQNASDTYSFDNGITFQSANVKSNLPIGNYEVKIKNATGCVSPSTTVTLAIQSSGTAYNAFVSAASEGGLNYSPAGGTIFRFNVDGTGYQKIYDAPGYQQSYQLTAMEDGYLYGGTSKDDFWKEESSLYRIRPDGTGYQVVKKFSPLNSVETGHSTAGQFFLRGGKLYGTNGNGGPGVGGTIFSVNPNGTGFTTLMSFNYSSFRSPVLWFISESDQFIYGSLANTSSSAIGGNIFRMKPNGSQYQVLHEFAIPYETSGSYVLAKAFSSGALQLGPDGKLYGLFANGGTQQGIIYRMNTDGTGFAILKQLATADGYPIDFVFSQTGDLFGVTTERGQNNKGIIFKISPSGVYSKIFDFPSEWGNSGRLTMVGNEIWAPASSGGSYGKGAIYKFNVNTHEVVKVLDLKSRFGYNVYKLIPITIDPAQLCIPTSARFGDFPNKLTKSSFKIRWNGVANATAYRMDVSTTENFQNTLPAYNNVLVADTLTEITGLSANTDYYVRLRATNSANTSGNSAVFWAKTAPNEPLVSSPQNVNYNVFTVNWNSISIQGNMKWFQYDVATDEAFANRIYNNALLPSPAATSVTIKVPAPGMYYFRINHTSEPMLFTNTPYMGSGVTVTSPYSNVVVVTTPDFGTPVQVVAKDVTTNRFIASWAAVQGATSYFIDVATDENFANLVPGYNNLSVSGTSQLVQGLQNVTNYYFRVRAFDSSNTSASSAIVSLTTNLSPPQLLPATDLTTTGFTIRWLPVAGATSYRVDVMRRFNPPLPEYNNLDVGNVTNLMVTGLTPATGYDYKVRAVRGSIISADAVFASLYFKTKSTSYPDQTITFPPLADRKFGDPNITLPATSSSGMNISYESSNPGVGSLQGNLLIILNAGTTIITASQLGGYSSGGTYYNPASSVSQTLTVNPGDNIITFDPIPAKNVSDQSFKLSATASSKLPVSYRSSNPLVATISGNVVTILGAGTTTITASQNGDAYGRFNIAIEKTQELVVNSCVITPPLPLLTVEHPTCSSLGTITITIQNASDTYSFDNGTTFQTSNTKSSLTVGNYQVKIKNAAGCISAATTATINAAPGSPATLAVTITQPICTVATGTIAVTVQNATDTYSFDNGTTFQASNTKSSLPVGNYQVKIKNATGCISPATNATINPAPRRPQTPVVSITPTTCTTATGTITVTEQNATDTYSFNNGSTYEASNSISLSPGLYMVKIKSADGCISLPATAPIGNPPPVPTAPSVSVIQPPCFSATGTITASVQNSTDTYSFDDGTTFQVSNTKSSLTVGNYQVKIKNAAGCISSAASAIINVAPGSPTIPDVTITQPTCSVTTGTITVTVQNASDTYSFDNGFTFQTSNSKSSLTPATYQMKIKNAAGCISTAASATINAASGSTAAPVISTTQPTCTIATGTIAVTVQNASDTYSFDNGTTFQVSNSKSGLTTGIYQIKIKKSSGCISSATPTSIQEQPNIPDTPEIFTYQPTCSVSTGTITVTIQNASDTYSFDNGATFQYSNSKSDLTNGNYQIKIKRNSGCISAATSATIQSQPVSPDKPQVSITQPTCSLLTGSIAVTVQNSNDTYSFDNGVTFQQSNTSTELTSKVYTVRIKNSLGCISPETLAIISGGSSPEPPVVSTAQPTCSVATGTITVTIQRGNDVYSFDDGATFQLSNSKSGSTSGTYKIKVKTGLGCISSVTSVTVNAQPTSPTQPSLTLDLTHPEAPVLRSHSTTQASSYQWYKNGKAITNSNHATLPINANDGSLYSVVIFSSAGCASLPSESKSAVVTGDIDSSPLSSVRLFPNPVNESLLISGINQTEQIKILSSTGVIQMVQSEWSELQQVRVVSVVGLASGLYFLQIQSDEQHLILKFIKE